MLRKALYGLKQAPRVKYAKVVEFLTYSSYSMAYAYSNLFTKASEGKLAMHVNDLFLLVMMKKRFGEQKRTYRFTFKKLSQIKHFFRLEVDQMKRRIFFANRNIPKTCLRSFECWNASQSQLELKLLQNYTHMKAKIYKTEHCIDN